MKTRSLAAITLTVISIGALAACGQPAQSQPQTPAQIWHELVACARAHGDPSLPDPTIDSQGRAQFPPGTPAPSQATRQACQSIYNRLPAAARTDVSAADIAMEIKFAQCMRAHGLADWPDPNANGDYALPSALQANMKAGPLWERIKTAWDACRAFNPSGHISTTNG